MKRGDLFQHFKGGLYRIVSPRAISGIPPDVQEVVFVHIVLNAERLDIEYQLFRSTAKDDETDFLIGCSSDPKQVFVVYQSEKTHQMWVRPLKNFLEVLPKERGGGPRFYEIQ